MKIKALPPSEPERTTKKKIRPPFDFFGMTPSFYLNGKDKTVSGIGFLCSIVLVLSLLAVTIIYSIIFLQNKSMTIYTSLETVDNTPEIELKDKKFVIAYRTFYPNNKPYSGMQEKFFKVKFYRTDESPIN
jgi:hypothetical protein